MSQVGTVVILCRDEDTDVENGWVSCLALQLVIMETEQKCRQSGSPQILTLNWYSKPPCRGGTWDGGGRVGEKGSRGVQCHASATQLKAELGFEPVSWCLAQPPGVLQLHHEVYPLHNGHFAYERKKVNFQFYTWIVDLSTLGSNSSCLTLSAL